MDFTIIRIAVSQSRTSRLARFQQVGRIFGFKRDHTANGA